MHWSGHTTGSNAKGAIVVNADDDTKAEAGFQAALDAAMSLVEHVGKPDDPVVVTVAGYAYPDHEPNGEPNEVITITVAARPEDRPADVEPE